MNFEQLNNDVIVARDSARMLDAEVAPAGGTVIETKVYGFWKNDGYDDKVPVPAS
ncbi:MAG TPA: hypothetical protein VEO54_10850 [Thermoanaerobaculia bacterium]|nr:hypothetical protein [Thermoanaerobaculia bacterium]